MAELNNLWYVGVIIVFLGSLGGALGDTMVRRSYVQAGDSAKAIKMLRTPLFVTGILLTVVVDPLFTFLGLLFAPSSMVTPFAGVHIFWAVLIAHFWLKEPMNRRKTAGAVGIVLGVILIVLFSSKGADIEEINDFDTYAGSAEAIAYIVVSAVLLLFTAPVACSLCPCSFGHWDYSIKQLTTALASGFLGGNTNVALKFFTIIVVQVFSGHFSVFCNWRTYVVTGCVILLAVLQLIFLNIALRRYEAVYVIPTINSCLVASGTIGSILVLHEIPQNWPPFCVGLLTCVGGILILTCAQQQPTDHPAADLQTDVSGPHALAAAAAGEEQQKSGAVLEPRRRHSLNIVSHSLSIPATAVGDMTIVLNSKAVYSMYTMKEKQRRHTIASGLGLQPLASSPALPLASESSGAAAEPRRISMEALTGWFTRMRDRFAAGGGGATHADEDHADLPARSTVSEPVMRIHRFSPGGRLTAADARIDPIAAATAWGHPRSCRLSATHVADASSKPFDSATSTVACAPLAPTAAAAATPDAAAGAAPPAAAPPAAAAPTGAAATGAVAAAEGQQQS